MTNPGPECCTHDPLSSGALGQESHRKDMDRRLARLQGQVGGIRRMVEEGRWCPDVLNQVEAVQEGLRAISARLLEEHIRHCVVEAARSDTPQVLERKLEEVAVLLRRRRT